MDNRAPSSHPLSLLSDVVSLIENRGRAIERHNVHHVGAEGNLPVVLTLELVDVAVEGEDDAGDDGDGERDEADDGAAQFAVGRR